MQFGCTVQGLSASSSTQTSKRMSNGSISKSSTLRVLRGLLSATVTSVLSSAQEARRWPNPFQAHQGRE